tara:strand:+ start:1289 stop:1594 length:306 start_codon:yes stop_codon:yes gene_type:complete
MIKIVITLLITLLLIPITVLAEKIDCKKFNKVSAEYLKCSAKNVKEESSKLKLKVTVGAEKLKKKISKNTANGKKKFDKLNLKEKLVKFKNSKSLTEFMEK